MSLSSNFKIVFDIINSDIDSLQGSIPLSTSQLANDSGFVTSAYVDAEVSGKQDAITSSNKLDYALLSGTPTIPTKTSDLNNDSNFATETYVDEQISGKLDAPSGGISGQVLTKTNDGVEWATGGGVAINPAYIEVEEKTALAPAKFIVDFSGKQIQKYEINDAAGGAIEIEIINSGKADGYASTVELQVPLSSDVDSITLSPNVQVIDIPDSLTGDLQDDRIAKSILYHDFVFRNEKNFIGKWQTYMNHSYVFKEYQNYDYFWIEAREDDSTITCDNFNASYNLSSSFDKVTWTALTGSTVATGVNAGMKIYIIGNTTTLGSTSSSNGCRFTSNKNYALGGKVLSLFSDWLEPKTLTNANDLKRWQYQKTTLVECSVDFEPITNTEKMFQSCSSLSALPDGFSCPNATNTNSMFGSCSNLSALPDGFSCPNTTNTEYMFYSCNSLTTIGNNVKIANGQTAPSTDDTYINRSRITTIGDNFEWFTNARFKGTWDPALGIKNIFPNAVNVGSGWKVYDHYDGE